MAQLVGLIVSEDEAFRKQVGRLLRSGTVPVSVIDERVREGRPPDLIVVDIRGDARRRCRSHRARSGRRPGRRQSSRSRSTPIPT